MKRARFMVAVLSKSAYWPISEQIGMPAFAAPIACSVSLEKTHMRKALLPILAAGASLFASYAYADIYTGVVDGFDFEASVLIVDGSQEFLIPEEVALPDMEAGDTVTIDYDDQDGTKIANSVTLSQ
ncbi:hypothetical protein [uncultured Cohaesibacter sp.]|uniref:hypothetical protein n=1 Tax=uncultured Cohaesibacter sp. TaxID=1002546 RepID=UPI0029C8A4FA|nr:hypothetical protein [uncultured Cohaesibacter sp.]